MKLSLLFVKYCNIIVKDGHMVEDNTIAESVLTLIPEYLDLAVRQCDVYSVSIFLTVYVV